MQNDLDGILAALEPETTEAGLPAGWRMEKPMSMLIGPPVVSSQTVTMRGKIVKRLTADSRKALKEYGAMRWPVLDRNSPDAERIWLEHSNTVHAEQDRLRAAMAPKVTASPEYKSREPVQRIVRI
jgi:hypothetical protein